MHQLRTIDFSDPLSPECGFGTNLTKLTNRFPIPIADQDLAIETGQEKLPALKAFDIGLRVAKSNIPRDYRLMGHL